MATNTIHCRRTLLFCPPTLRSHDTLQTLIRSLLCPSTKHNGVPTRVHTNASACRCDSRVPASHNVGVRARWQLACQLGVSCQPACRQETLKHMNNWKRHSKASVHEHHDHRARSGHGTPRQEEEQVCLDLCGSSMLAEAPNTVCLYQVWLLECWCWLKRWKVKNVYSVPVGGNRNE